MFFFIFRVGLCVINFFLGLPMVCRGGYYLLFLVDWAMSGYPLMFICVIEIIIICYSYGEFFAPKSTAACLGLHFAFKSVRPTGPGF